MMITLSPSTSMFISVPSYHPNSDTIHSGTLITYSPVTLSTSTVEKFFSRFFSILGISFFIFVLYRKTMSYIKSSRKQDFIAYRDPLNLIHGRDRRTPTAGGTGKSRTHKGAGHTPRTAERRSRRATAAWRRALASLSPTQARPRELTGFSVPIRPAPMAMSP